MRSVLDNVGGWPRRWAERAGERLAIVDGDRRLDYATLEVRVSRLAGGLAASGVARGDRVAALLGNRAATLELLFAAASLGAIFVPVNVRLSPREIAFLLDDCRPRALFYEAELASTAEAACESAACPPALRVEVGGDPDPYETLLDPAPGRVAVAAVSPDDPMMLMYTSGTTGHPKGALLPHRKALFNSLNAQLFFGIRGEDRVLAVVPLFHSLGLQILSLPVLYAGAALILQRRFEPVAVWRTVERERISYFGAVPTMYRQLYDALPPDSEATSLRSLRFLFTAGAAISVELIHAYRERGLLLKQGYGQTETSILCCLDERDAIRKAGSVGRPVFHADVRVVSRESIEGPSTSWRETPVGETGEIVARGPIAMLGYWERPEATAETLRDGWVRTGDLAHCDDEGFITLVGRARDMFISGGENVYPAEVEAVYREHPAIRDIAVVGVADPRWGEVGRAHLVFGPGQALERDELIEWAGPRLARFKIPKTFRSCRALPKTVTGKVRKYQLQQEP